MHFFLEGSRVNFIIYQTYADVRPLLQDGDIVFYSSHDGIGDKIIKWWQRVVRRQQTRDGDQFSHVGTVLTMGGRPFLLEASFRGGVRMVPLSLRQPDVVVSMNLQWNQEAEEYAMAKLGMKYGLWEAIKAAVGLRETDDDKFICTEYVAKITNKLGYYLPQTKQLPSIFYYQLLKTDLTFRVIVHPEKSKI
jgi:hypothetical protein